MTEPQPASASAPDAVLARLAPVATGRVTGVVLVLLVAAQLARTGLAPLTGGAAPLWQALLLLPAVAALWFAGRFWRATGLALELTGAVLQDSSGRVVARVEEILALDRGAFGLKPAGGFVVRLSSRPGTAWQPGLWWRVGGRVGVGGVTARRDAQAMADALTALLAPRQG